MILPDQFCDHARIFWALLCRDMRMLKRNLPDLLIDGSVVMITQVLIFGRFFPLMGMDASLIASVYLGAAISFIFSLGFALGLKNAYDVAFGKYIEYRLTLALPKRWILAQAVVYFVIESLVITTPLLSAGIFFLRDSFGTVAPHWPSFIFMYLCTLIFFGTFMLGMSFYYDLAYFGGNVWPRRLTPLFCIGVLFVPWYGVYQFSKTIAWLLLVNPTTYYAEGLRATFIADGNHLTIAYCFPMAIILIVVAGIFLARGVKKRLDPV